MASTQDLLHQLKDIHLPAAPSIWPLAPGWYGVILVLVLAAGFGSYKVYQQWQRKRYRKIALTALSQLETAAKVSGLNAEIMANLSIIIRRTALAAYPRDKVAGLQGIAWLQFLDKTGKTEQFTQGIGRELITAPYQAHSHKAAIEPLFAIVKQWIEKHSN